MHTVDKFEVGWSRYPQTGLVVFKNYLLDTR